MRTMRRKVIATIQIFVPYFLNKDSDCIMAILTTINELIFKLGEEGAIGWSAAPTLVERQRENLTERLKREFGLFLSDDEEERARKHGIYFLKIHTRERI